MYRAFNDNVKSFNNSFNNEIVLNQCTFTTSDEEPKILAWLSTLEPQVRHQDIRNDRVNGVGNWLLETKEFRSWFDGSEEDESDRAALLCYGDPGVGKSYISSIVVDFLCDHAIEEDMAVACFYYDFASREEQSPTNMLGSVLKQIIGGLEAIPGDITRKFRGQKKVIGGRRLQLSDIVNLFPTVPTIQRTFICIDALDECVPKHRLEVLVALCQLLERSPNTRIFMTGRPHIRDEVERQLGGKAATVSIKPKDRDITTYLSARLSKDTTPEVMDSGLREEIMKNIPEEISETFLLVSLKIESILRETTIHRRRMRLNTNTMGDGLGLRDAYDATMERISAQDGEKVKLALATLMWICHAERPLQADELCNALAVEIGSTDFNSDNVPRIETLLACCLGLVTVDKEASTIRLIHHTLQEYLSAHPNLFDRAHSKMAETCLTYLNSSQAKALPANQEDDVSSMPFLRYCSRYWGAHAKRELSDRTKLLAMELLDRGGDHISARLLSEIVSTSSASYDMDAFSICTGLHAASFFGIVEVMTILLGVDCCDINQRDCLGMTPLIWAVIDGQEEAINLLLGQEAVNPDLPDNKGQTPLHWAALNGHESIVKLLLEKEEVNPDRPDNEGLTPLHWAALYGHESVVKLLLEKEDVNPDRPENEGQTPLHCAALAGHEPVVKLLLEKEDVNPDRPDNEGLTPLHSAAFNGHESVIKLLLEKEDVNPDRPDNEGLTPLHCAALTGHVSVVQLLFEKEGVNPDRPDNDGQTPLHCAALDGHESVVKLLLEKEAVNPDRPDNEGKTPLHWAALDGHESVVKLLLEKEGVNPDRPDNQGDTPLHCAALNGHESVVQLLLEKEEVNPDRPDNEGKTPLHCAALTGHESVVKLLLEKEDVNPDRPDNQGQTPLHFAALKGHESVVKLLLEKEDVNPDRPGNEGQTPLHFAALNGHESVVKLLLGKEDVNPDRPDNEGHTPFHWAARAGREAITKLLSER